MELGQRTILSALGPVVRPRLAVAEGLMSYVWLQEAHVTVQLRKPTEPRYFGVCVTFGRLWNNRVAKYSDPLVLWTARGPHCRPVEAVERWQIYRVADYHCIICWWCL